MITGALQRRTEGGDKTIFVIVTAEKFFLVAVQAIGWNKYNKKKKKKSRGGKVKG